MAKSLLTMLVSVVIFFMARPTFSQEIDQYSQEVPEDVNISSSPDFSIYVEGPDESLFEADSPAMEYDMEPEQQKQLEFLNGCLRKLNSNCGDDIFKSMLDETTHTLTNECCRYLLEIGKDCHLGLAQIVFSSYEYRNIAYKAIPKCKHSKAIPKTKQTWNDCVRRVGNQVGTW